MNDLQKAMNLMEEGDTEEALSLVKEMLPAAEDNDVFEIGEFYLSWGYFEEAAGLFEKLLEKYEDEGQLLTKLAEIYIELEEDERAIQLLNRVQKEDDYYVDALIYLADLYQTQGLFEVTEEKLLEAKQLAPDEIVIDFALGEFLFSIGQPNRAIPFYEKTAEQASELNGVSIDERLAESHASIGHYEEALAYYGEVESENPDTLFKHGFTAFHQHQNETAIKMWKKLMEVDPYYYSVYSELASALKETGQLQEAYEIAKKGIGYDEFNKELFFIAGQIAVQLGNTKEGLEHIHQAVTLDHDYKEAVLALITLYKQEDAYEEIIELITAIQETGARDGMYDWELAKAYVEMEHYKEALQSYQDAYEALKEDSEFLKEYGFFLSEEGRNREAVDVLAAYMKMEPLDEDTQAFIARLNDSNPF